MAIAYWTVAGLTFSVILSAFLKDQATRKISLRAWSFIAIATLIWPVTLPFIISSKLRAAQAKQAAKQAAQKDANMLTQLQTAPAGDS